jgi:hypothetical protein
MYRWFQDIITESAYQGHHTRSVAAGLFSSMDLVVQSVGLVGEKGSWVWLAAALVLGVIGIGACSKKTPELASGRQADSAQQVLELVVDPSMPVLCGIQADPADMHGFVTVTRKEHILTPDQYSARY